MFSVPLCISDKETLEISQWVQTKRRYVTQYKQEKLNSKLSVFILLLLTYGLKEGRLDPKCYFNESYKKGTVTLNKTLGKALLN